MMIELDPAIASSLEGKEDVQGFVNGVLAAYLHNQFIRKSDVAGVAVASKMYRRLSVEANHVFDTITDQFVGVAVESEKVGDVAFIPSERLFELLQKHQVILVMNSPRTKEVPVEESTGWFIKMQSEEYV